MNDHRYIVERSTFGGPWKPLSVGRKIDAYQPTSLDNFRRYTLAEAEGLVNYLNALNEGEQNGIRCRVTLAEEYEQSLTGSGD